MKILYISYNGLMEPLFQSQGMPYIMNARRGGYDFCLLTFEFVENTGKHNPAFLTMRDRLSQAGIVWRNLRFHRGPAFIAKIYDLLAGVAASFILSARLRPDAIQARGLFSALVAIPVSFITGKPLIFDTRSKLSEAYAISGKWKRGGATSKLMNFLEERCLKSAKAIIVETTDHKKEVEDLLSGNNMTKPIEVIPCCVDLDRFKCAETVQRRDREFTISYLGSLSGWYCLKETIAFFKKVNEELPGSKMAFLTKGDPGAILEYIKESKLPEDSVKFFDLAPDMVPHYLAASSAGIMFKYPDQRLSSFPVKIGEYLASGIPVIINHGTGDVEKFILGNNVGVAIDGFSEEAFKRGVSAILSLSKEKDIRERCLSAARKLSAENGAQRYMKIYELIDKGMAF